MIRVCPHSDSVCPHGLTCAYSCANENYNGTKTMTYDPKDEFCARFKARMIEMVGPTYTALDEDGRPDEEGLSTAEYADEAAPTYWDDPVQREEGPEACAEADYSYWGD